MGVNPEVDREKASTPTLEMLRPWHRRIAQMVAAGMRPSEIASATGYSNTQVSVIMGTPLFMCEVDRIQSMAECELVNTMADMRSLLPRAVEVLAEDLHQPGVERKHRAAVAFGILDRTGYGKTEKHEGKNVHLHLHREVREMSDEELEREVQGLIGEGGE
jgi:hypothetical protein